MVAFKESDFQFWGKAILSPKTITGKEVRSVIQYIDWNTTGSTYRTQTSGDDVYFSKATMNKAPSGTMVLKGAGHGSHFGYASVPGGSGAEIYITWNRQVVRVPYLPGRTLTINSPEVTKLGTRTATRISVDKAPGRKYILAVNGLSANQNLTYELRDRENTKVIKSVKAVAFGATNKLETYQSSALAYPHMFTIFGDTDEKKPVAIYYYNFETAENKRIPLNFTDGTLYNPTHPVTGKKHREPETINIIFAKDDTKKENPIVAISIVGHDPALSNPVAGAKINRIYVASTSGRKDIYFGREVHGPTGTYVAQRNMSIYDSVDFSTTNKVGSIKAGEKVSVVGLAETPAGTPRLKISGGRYISANMKFIALDTLK